MREKILAYILVQCLLLMTASVVRSADLQSSFSDWEKVRAIAKGHRLQVKLKGGKTIDGLLDAVSDAEIRIAVRNGYESPNRDSVKQVFLVLNKNFSKSIVIGTLSGAAIGIAGAVSIASTNDADGLPASAYTLPIIGAGIGALVGLIFRKKTRKQLVFENP